MSFAEYVADLVKQNPNQRVFSLVYEGKKFWVKQVEKTTGAMRLLKPNPHASLQREIKTLQYLNQQQAAVAKLVLVSDNYFVIEDVGRSIKKYLDDDQITPEFTQRLLHDAAMALAKLHQQDLFHGRPAIRDMGWKEDGVRFIDFESQVFSQNLQLQKARDLLFYIHSLYVSEEVTDQQIAESINVYRQHHGESQWQYTYQLVYRWRGLYTFLNLFRCVARTDLIALLKLFRFIFAYGNHKL